MARLIRCADTRSDNVALIVELARNGVGIGRVMDLLAAPHIGSGELVPVLQDQIDGEQVPIYALTLKERHRQPKVRACNRSLGAVALDSCRLGEALRLVVEHDRLTWVNASPYPAPRLFSGA